jgi:hypothetical protein
MSAVPVIEAPSTRQRSRSAVARPERVAREPHALLSLQPLVGNAAVASLLAPARETVRAPAAVAQRLVTGGSLPAPPVAPSPADPASHPGLRAVRASVKSAATKAARHPSPRAAVATAEKAVEPAADEAEAQAKKERAATIGNAPTPGFDKAAFIAAVNAAIVKQTPKTLEDAAEFGSSGKAESVGAEVKGRVSQSKTASTGPLAEATAQPPDTSRASITPGTPLPAQPPTLVPALGAGRAAPTPAPPEQTNLDHGPAQVDQEMSGAGVTEEQLRNSNEPEFTDALSAKGEAAQHAATAPAAMREREAGVIAGAQQDSASTGAGGAAALAAGRAAGLGSMLGGQREAKSAAEGTHAQVNADLRAIFDKTKTDVEAILTSIDGVVEADFTAGERDARSAFKKFHEKEMDAFKEREYGWNPLAWGKDLLFGPPPGAKAVFEKSRTFYQNEMTNVISAIADKVGKRLNDAKARVAKGKEQIAAHVQGLAPELRAEGAKAAQRFAGEFDQLEQSVDEKSQAVVEDLASKYVAAKGEVDAEITKMQEESKGLVGRAVAAVAGVITTIKNLAAMLTQVLARAAGAVDKIIKDPIGFLGNFVNAVKGGIQQFGDNIATHLKAGLQSWLFGALAEGGIELPQQFDLKGVLQLVLSILGLTKEKVLARIAAKLPPGTIEKVIQGFGVVKTIVTTGVAGLWQMLLDKIGDIKEMVMSQVQEMVSVEIIKAGIVWLISMLNPASAFVKACKMIYDVVMFFVEKAAQIKEFVDSILDSVESIAGGGVGAVAGYIEKTLGRMVPVIIGFMASLLGLGGISGKIKAILEKIQAPVNKAIDWVVGKAVAFGKKAIALGKKVLGKVKALGKKAVGGIKKKLGIKEKSPAEREHEGLLAGVRVVNQFAGRQVGAETLNSKLAGVREKNRLAVLEPFPANGLWSVRSVAQREDDPTRALVAGASTASTDANIGSAPGIGEVQAHGAQAPRNRGGGNPLHYTESEHIIPFAMGQVLLDAAGASGGGRKANRRFDQALITIVIYERAARIKTPVDRDRINTFKAETANAIAATKQARRGKEPTAPVDWDIVLALLDHAHVDAVARTINAVKKEHGERAGSGANPNGKTRGEKDPIPTPSAIKDAGQREFTQMNAIFRRLWLEAAKAAGTGATGGLPQISSTTLAALNGMQPDVIAVLPGIGARQAARVAAERQNGPYLSKADLASRVPNLRKKFLAAIK